MCKIVQLCWANIHTAVSLVVCSEVVWIQCKAGQKKKMGINQKLVKCSLGLM